MNKYAAIPILALSIVCFSACGPTQIVASRPAEIIYTRLAAPGPGYIWINGDWYWRGGRYEWHEGRWDRGRAGRNWHEGNWTQTPRGWKWNRGHWR